MLTPYRGVSPQHRCITAFRRNAGATRSTRNADPSTRSRTFLVALCATLGGLACSRVSTSPVNDVTSTQVVTKPESRAFLFVPCSRPINDEDGSLRLCVSTHEQCITRTKRDVGTKKTLNRWGYDVAIGGGLAAAGAYSLSKGGGEKDQNIGIGLLAGAGAELVFLTIQSLRSIDSIQEQTDDSAPIRCNSVKATLPKLASVEVRIDDTTFVGRSESESNAGWLRVEDAGRKLADTLERANGQSVPFAATATLGQLTCSTRKLSDIVADSDVAALLETRRQAAAERQRLADAAAHEEQCVRLQIHTTRTELDVLEKLASQCPERVSEKQAQWLTDARREREIAAGYEAAVAGNSDMMHRFYNKYYETGDSRVEQIRRLALSKFGPKNPTQFQSASRRLSAMSTRSFSVWLCDVRDGTATAGLTFTTETAMIGMAGLIFGNGQEAVANFRRLADAREQSRQAVETATKAMTGAKDVRIMNGCTSPHWYINDRPWPPKPVGSGGANKN